jgi:aconitate hydratase
MNYLASPLLVVAYALAGNMNFDFDKDSLGEDSNGYPIFLKDIWPTPSEIESLVASSISSEMFKKDYASVFDGDHRWKSLDTPTGNTFEWDPKSTYVRKPPYFEGMPRNPEPVKDISGARVLAVLGDSVTTDHISPAGNIKADSPAGKYLAANGIERGDFNSYGSRRGNHEVMIRGTFANIRLKNLLLDGVEGGFTKNFLRNSEQSTIYDASMEYQSANIPLVILAGKEYGSGSSRDWAAKGTALLGVKAVIAESFERIHRSNLIGMGVLPLQFPKGETASSLGLKGDEVFEFIGITELNNGNTPKTIKVTANGKSFDAVVRIDTPGEADYYRHGGIMQYVLRSLLK